MHHTVDVANDLMCWESMTNGDELQKHWYEALFQCDKHHYWRLQTYTCTDCHALAYMTDTLYIVLCYSHSSKEATTQLTQPRFSLDASHRDTQCVESPLVAAGGYKYSSGQSTL